MESKEIDVIINNNTCWRLMVKLIKLRGSNIKTISDLAKELNVSRHHEYFNKIIKMLIEKDIIIVEMIGRYMRITDIKYKEIAKLLRKSKDFKYAGYIIELTKTGYSY